MNDDIHKVLNPIRDRVSRNEAVIGVLKDEGVSLKTELSSLNTKMVDMKDDLRNDIASVENRLSGHLHNHHSEMMNVLHDHIDDDAHQQRELQKTLSRMETNQTEENGKIQQISTIMKIGWVIFVGVVSMAAWFAHEVGLVGIIVSNLAG